MAADPSPSPSDALGAASGAMPLADELTSVFARMSGLLLYRETVDTVLRMVTALALEAIPGADGAGISLMDTLGRRTSAAATDVLVEQADALQYELNEGPCLAAWASRSVVRIDQTATDTRWPRWAAGAVGMGLGSALSAPLIAGGEALGAMKVYAAPESAFDPHAERLLALFAAQAAVLVANVQSQDSAIRMSDSLKAALRSRDVIGQAKGIIMTSRGVDEDAAFAVLAAASQAQNKRISDIAQDLVRAANRRQR